LVEAGDTVPDKATFLKGFGRRHDIPMLVLHQTSRTAGADGKKMTMSSGSYGGEQQATSIIGVRRKKYQIAHEMYEIIEKLDRSHSERAQDRLEYLRHEARIHEHTVTVSLLKNKRPAGQLVDDIDFVFIDGSHDYLNVKQDIATWFPMTHSNSIIAGHDYGSFDGVTKAVNEEFGGKVKRGPGSIWYVDRSELPS
jgi:hypothetical protein